VAEILNTTPDHIPDDWPTCPQYTNRSSKRQCAVSWMRAILVNTRIQQRELTLLEYIDILKRSRWKLHGKDNKRRGMVTLLETLELAPKMGTETKKKKNS
jgi:hypothetical protein